MHLPSIRDAWSEIIADEEQPVRPGRNGLLTAERNEMLTRVGAGTPMGELLRRYWQPHCWRKSTSRSIRSSRYALWARTWCSTAISMDAMASSNRHCPHRRADLAYGWVEETGIRCSYHGWLMDGLGRCLEQPYEDIASPKPSRAGCDAKAYPVKECTSLVFAYLGPKPAPELPVWEPFTWPNGFREIVLADVPCNWFQCQENSIDPVHFEWMHDNWAAGSGNDSNAAPKTSQTEIRGVRARLRLQARARRSKRGRPLLDRRARCLVAQRFLSRQPFRMARAGRR